VQIAQIFQVLNTPEQQRFKNLDESLAAFPYVNGKLFEEQLPLAHFDSSMRQTLLDSCLLDWGRISPAIFGSLFQSVMDEKSRRNLGAHYTSEKNILKLIRPLFMDELWAEFEKCKQERGKLKKLHEKISKLRFLDPACGCGNFLIIAYRELRLLELEIVKAEFKGQLITNINEYFLVDVNQFYGIEYEEFPSQIAQVAMWLIDHQMNEQASRQFGEYFRRIPLRKSATIRHGNALRIEWQSLIDPMPWEKEAPRFHYILGNPPFVGKQMQDKDQKADMDLIFAGVPAFGALDYVCAWYLRAAKYLQEYNPTNSFDTPLTRVAFVSTNSITKGEQVAILWGELFNRYRIKIHFAHRTFKWGNEARGNAAVHVVIVGFSNFDVSEKWIYEYEEVQGEPHASKVKNVNPYLVEGKDEFVVRRKTPICGVPELIYGNKPTDEGNFLFTPEEKDAFLQSEPGAVKWFRRFMGSFEFINNVERWC
jgi:type II restriction/modification system DNA methylase subunit YeeA